MRKTQILAKTLLALSLALPTYVVADVKIGFIGTLSGPSADVGRDQLDAFKMALDELDNKLGGVDVKLIEIDDQQKPDAALNGVTRLLEQEEVDIVTGLTFAHVLMALQNKIAATDVPFIGTVAGPSATAGDQCKSNLFVMSWQSDTPAEAIGKYLQDKGVQRLSTLTPNFVGGKDKISGLKTFYKGEVVDEVYTPLNQLDFSAELTQVASAGPEAIYVFYPGALGISFVRQYQQSGLNAQIPLYSTNTMEGDAVNAMGEAAIGTVVADTWTPGMPTERSQQFVADFSERYGRTPTAYAAFSYDAAMLLNEVVKELDGDVSDKKRLAETIKAAKFDSLRGDFRFGNNNYPIQNYHVFEIVAGDQGKPEFTLVAENVLQDQADQYADQCPMK